MESTTTDLVLSKSPPQGDEELLDMRAAGGANLASQLSRLLRGRYKLAAILSGERLPNAEIVLAVDAWLARQKSDDPQ